MNINYRNYNDNDIDTIIDFWNTNSGWETDLNRDVFNQRFCSSPLGRPLMMMAIEQNENSIIGLCCFIPVSVTLHGEEKKAYRPFGAIFKDSVRDKFGITSLLSGKHPILQLYLEGAKEAQKQNAALTYIIPDPRWKRLTVIMPFQTHKFPLWRYDLPLQPTFPSNEKFICEQIDPSNENINELWKKSDKANVCTMTKDNIFYQTKMMVRQGAVKLWGVKNGEELVGIFTLQYKAEDKQWIIGDIVSLDNNNYLDSTLIVACHTIQSEYKILNPPPGETYKISILANEQIAKKVKELQFVKDKYDFLFCVHLLDNTFSKADVAPQKWYISAND